MLSDNVEGSRRRAPETMTLEGTLREAMSELECVGAHQCAAFRSLDEILPLNDQEQLVTQLQAAEVAAREHTMLIVRPVIPPRASTVLRKRPDLDTAYAVSLAELGRRSLGGR
jgi:hypothetical protein